jgi:glycosyltransferase involved in cell wall biosynthesis
MLNTPLLPRLPITALVLTHNEERNLSDCLASLAGWTTKIVVVDSGSTDGTMAVATRYGALVLSHQFEGHAKQWRWALENLPYDSEWILGLDADQRVTPALRDELCMTFSAPSTIEGVEGFYTKRREIFRGRWIRHGGYYPKYLLKLFRRDNVFIDDGELVDHHFYVRGPTRKLTEDIVEENRREDDLLFWIEKHVRYARLQAEQEFRYRGQWPIRPSLFGSPDQRTMWLKSYWYRMPLYIRPCLYFLYRYVIRLGFLDGKEGFVFHALHAFWFRLLVDVYQDELKRGGTAS